MKTKNFIDNNYSTGCLNANEIKIKKVSIMKTCFFIRLPKKISFREMETFGVVIWFF